MNFEKLIKNLSAFVAGSVVFFLALGMYLSFKGFVFYPDGRIELIPAANASQKNLQNGKIAPNLLIPWGPQLGSNKAKITLYEFSSYGCFHCAEFQLKTLPVIKKKYIDTGILRIVFSDFPLDKNSMQASMLAHCFSGNKFFEFSDLLFAEQKKWGLSRKPYETFLKYAQSFGLSKEKALACMQDKEVAEEILERRQFAIANLGISGTPSFVISSVKGREVIYGAPDINALEELIQKYLPASKN